MSKITGSDSETDAIISHSQACLGPTEALFFEAFLIMVHSFDEIDVVLNKIRYLNSNFGAHLQLLTTPPLSWNVWSVDVNVVPAE